MSSLSSRYIRKQEKYTHILYLWVQSWPGSLAIICRLASLRLSDLVQLECDGLVRKVRNSPSSVRTSGIMGIQGGNRTWPRKHISIIHNRLKAGRRYEGVWTGTSEGAGRPEKLQPAPQTSGWHSVCLSHKEILINKNWVKPKLSDYVLKRSIQ